MTDGKLVLLQQAKGQKSNRSMRTESGLLDGKNEDTSRLVMRFALPVTSFSNSALKEIHGFLQTLLFDLNSRQKMFNWHNIPKLTDSSQ